MVMEAMRIGLDDYILKTSKNYLHLAATVRSVLKRTKSERRKLSLETCYQTLLNRSSVGIFRSTLDGRILEANAAFLKLLGLSSLQEAQTIDLHNLYFRLEDRSRLLNLLKEKGHLDRYEVQLRRSNGSPVWVSLTETISKTPDGQKVIDGLIEDISESKQAEKELARQVEELARSNAELQEFANIVAHELKEPLRTAEKYTELLAESCKGKLDAEAVEYMSFILGGTNRMHTLINDLLVYARVGTHGESFKGFDSKAIFDAAISNLQTAIEESGAVVTCDSLPTIVSDASQMIQLFQNLIGNAIKFHGKNPPRVHVSAEQKGNEWLFSVRDNGIGIDPENTESIFGIFKRLHAEDEYSGTGIGLPICKKIVERHGGRIWVESEPKRGSTFYFTVPVIEEE
jgi:PAS domain S-box-containing protein